MKIYTVGELKDFLASIPNSTPIVHYEDGMEKYGFMAGVHANVRNMEEEVVRTYDAFDYTSYHYERLNTVAEGGTPYLTLE